MSMVPPRPSASQPPPNIIPTRQTRLVAQQMLAALATEGGYDVVLRMHAELHPDQWPALVAALLNTGRVGGRPAMKETRFTQAERRAGHAKYVQGDRSEDVVEAEREYQRLHKRRARKAA